MIDDLNSPKRTFPNLKFSDLQSRRKTGANANLN